MTEVEDRGTAAALDEVLAQHGSVRVLNRATVSTRPNNLKYMWVFPAFVVIVAACITSLYLSMKDTSGPLKPVFDRFEGLLSDFRGTPVYQKVNSSQLPLKILGFLDQKVDYVVQALDVVLPDTLKDLGFKVFDGSRSTVAGVQRDGFYVTAKGYFDKYEPVAESYGIRAYQKALTFPLVPQAVACTRYGAVKVNRIIVSLKESSLPLVSFLPLLPVNYFDKIARSE